MTSTQRPSPRKEALNAILETREGMDQPLISPVAWENLVSLAWDNRSHVGDRRDIRREVRRILLEDSRGTAEA